MYTLLNTVDNISYRKCLVGYANHECRSKFVAKHGVDERIDGAVCEANEVR